MRFNFFLKNSKLNSNLRPTVKNSEKIITSLDNWIGTGFFKVSVLSRQYFSSGVNVLTNGPKILDTTKTDICKFKFSQNDRKILSNYCRADFSSVCDS